MHFAKSLQPVRAMLLGLPQGVIVLCFSFLLDVEDRNHIAAVSRHVKNFSIMGISACIAQILNHHFSPLDIVINRSEASFGKRLQRLLASRFYASPPPAPGSIYYQWYTAQLRLQMLAARSFEGISAAEVVTICLHSFKLPELNIKDPRIRDLFSNHLQIGWFGFERKVEHFKFARFVSCRGKGEEDMELTLGRVLQSILKLGRLTRASLRVLESI